jgi:hypothetical protein
VGYSAGLRSGNRCDSFADWGTVRFGQAAQSFLDIWDAALAFIGIVTLSVILDAMGFQYCRGSCGFPSFMGRESLV